MKGVLETLFTFCRRLADLQLGSVVKVLATRGTGILPAVVR
jgi:hypothetical protein